MKYYRYLRDLIKVSGSQSRLFIDDSGFEEFQDCALGWSKKGKKIWVKSQENGEKRKSSSRSTKRKKGLNCPNCFYGQPQCRRF
ncbi:hypothetical protein E5S67_06218 [Microcoleus sp. IPMA8]|uniref:Transposase n=1 Tax=Microcoleus asticus IPMA8 TaxID=2563858 RepID=A0ABX2D8G2_9CYAN|nr:hypothetical protein [Microcoleus asticus IPMA8]